MLRILVFICDPKGFEPLGAEGVEEEQQIPHHNDHDNKIDEDAEIKRYNSESPNDPSNENYIDDSDATGSGTIIGKRQLPSNPPRREVNMKHPVDTSPYKVKEACFTDSVNFSS
jgi:hypothetical protein